MKILKVAVLVLAAQSSVAQQAAPISFEGRVLRQGTEVAISGADLELRKEGETTPAAVTVSSAEGRFAFRKLATGSYRLVASRSGYVRTAGSGIPITLRAGEAVPEIRLPLVPTAAIVGRITDKAGQSMPNATVQAVKSGYHDGQRTLTVVRSVRTNDLGDYRLFWLPPGKYYVSVLATGDPASASGVVLNPNGPRASSGNLWTSDDMPVAVRPVGIGIADDEAYAPIYFPGTAELGRASTVDLQPGIDVHSVDINARLVRAFGVRGVVTDNATRGPVQAQIWLFSTRPGNAALRTSADANGVFAMPKVPAGSYVAFATAAGELTGSARLEVRTGDVDIPLRVTSGLTISGRVVIEGQAPGSLSVSLAPDSPIQFAEPKDRTRPVVQSSSGVAADGTFRFTETPAIRYRVFVNPVLRAPGSAVRVPPTLERAYVKSIRMGDADVLNQGLDLEHQPAVPIEIVIGTNPGAVEGHASAANASVILVPTVDREFRSDLFKLATSDATGTFRFPIVPPGSYKVFAWESIEDGVWQDPAFLLRFEDRSTSIMIDEGGSRNVNVTAIAVAP